MRVLVTGSQGYIGSVLVPMLAEAGHEVIALDTGFYHSANFGPEPVPRPALRKDIRDVVPGDLEGIDAVIHLAALSNDPLGNLRPELTYDINHRGTISLARSAIEAGVSRFLFSSSCSLYGGSSGEFVDESAPMMPLTPYARSKVEAERDLARLASDRFSPVFLRNATAYGPSPALRCDLVVNNLVGYGVTTGRVVMMSDGTPWRPLVHVADIGRAFLAFLEAPRPVIHGEAFNVGRNDQNYQVKEVAEMVAEAVPASEVTFGGEPGPDRRNYRVDCSKLARLVPEAGPIRTVADGIGELISAFEQGGLDLHGLEHRHVRLEQLTALSRAGAVDETLRWVGDG